SFLLPRPAARHHRTPDMGMQFPGPVCGARARLPAYSSGRPGVADSGLDCTMGVSGNDPVHHAAGKLASAAPGPQAPQSRRRARIPLPAPAYSAARSFIPRCRIGRGPTDTSHTCVRRTRIKKKIAKHELKKLL